MTTPDPLTRAAAKLRDSVAGLPEYQRQPWEYRATSVHMNGSSYGSVVAVPHRGPSPVNGCTGTAGEHIALTASPDVTEATAALLAMPALGDDYKDWAIEAERRLLALAAAIERQET